MDRIIPQGRLLEKIENSGVDPSVVTCIREFLLGRTQGVRIGGEFSDEVRVTSGVPQGSVLGPLLFLAYVNDIGKNIDSNIRLFADECVIYKLSSVALVRERTIPTERPPPVGEVSANFCG